MCTLDVFLDTKKKWLVNEVEGFLNTLWNLQVGRNAFEIVRQCTNNFEKLRVEVVKEEHIKQGILMLEKEEMKVEGGGAITLAACMYNLREQLWGKK